MFFRYFFIILILVVFNQTTYSTNQVADYLIIEKDTFYFYESPLEQLHNITAKVKNLTNSTFVSSGCWRGFYAEWKILNNTLYLSKVFDCEDGEEIDDFFEDLFGYNPPNNLLKAKWINGITWYGKDLVRDRTLYLSIYRYEYRITVKKGIIEKTETSPTIECAYYNENKVKEFLISKIDWESYPKIKYGRLVIKAEFNVNIHGKIKNIEVTSSADSSMHQKILETLNILPCYQTYYFEGKLFNNKEWISITIREEDIASYLE